MNSNRDLMPYLLLALLFVATELGIALGASQAPETHTAAPFGIGVDVGVGARTCRSRPLYGLATRISLRQPRIIDHHLALTVRHQAPDGH